MLTRREFLEASTAFGIAVFAGGAEKLAKKAIAGSREIVNAQALIEAAETKEQVAAEIFGADEYSRNQSNWVANPDGGLTLIPNPSGNVTRINVRSAGVEGYTDAINADGSVWTEVMIIAGWNIPGNTAERHIKGATFWPFTFETREDDIQTLWAKVVEKETREQPGVPVRPEGFIPGIPPACKIDP